MKLQRKKSGSRGLVARGVLAVETFTFQHPRLMGWLLGGIRRVRPVVRVGSTAVVTQHALVKDILARDDDFTVQMYTPKMEKAVGPFILGMQDGPTYQRDNTNLRLAVPHDDLPWLKGVVAEIVEQHMVPARREGRVDIVRDLAERVPMELSARYFGAPSPQGDRLMRWSQAVFREFFYNIRNDPAISNPAWENAELLRSHIESVIAARKAASPGEAAAPPDVLDRMLELQAKGQPGVDDEWIRIYISGLIVGMLPLTAKVTSQVINEMLRKPALLEGARSAVLAGDDGLLWEYISESMRFAPQAPGQFRVANGEQTIGVPRKRSHRFPPGTQVLAATQAAMFDPLVISDRSKIRTDRPASELFHFGYGLHSCFGHQISEKVQVPAIIAAIVRQPGLARASGKAGRLKWRGPFPGSMEVTFDRSQG